jgi:hypothetical protein
MPELPLNIIDFVKQLELLEGVDLSPAQRAVLKATYGETLDAVEMEICRRATGREPVPCEQHELTVIAGRRSGKTSRVAALIALYEAFRAHGLPRGQHGYVLVIAPYVQQAAIAFKFIKSYIVGSEILRPLVHKYRKTEIELKNGVIIACCPCSYITVRGFSIICAICDEMAFWRHEETAANPEHEVLDAIRPAMATLSNTKLVKISTPFRKDGIIWREFLQRRDLDHLVWQLSTEEMNSAVPKDFLDKERRNNEQTFRREYCAEFTDNTLGWIPPEILEPCIQRGRRELPCVSSGTYVAAIDPAFHHDDFAFAVLHRSDEGMMTVAYLARWTGTKKVPLNVQPICELIHEVLERYGINTLFGDQYCFAVIKQQLAKLGILYREFAFGTNTRAKIYGNLRQLMVEEKIAFTDDPELRRQFLRLEEIRRPNGNTDFRPPGSSKDDMAIAVALAAYKLSQLETTLRTPFLMPGADLSPSLNLNPNDCYVAARCDNFPVCTDEGCCLGFRDSGILSGAGRTSPLVLISERKKLPIADRAQF